MWFFCKNKVRQIIFLYVLEGDLSMLSKNPGIPGFWGKQVQLPITLREADRTFSEVREGSKVLQKHLNILNMFYRNIIVSLIQLRHLKTRM